MSLVKKIVIGIALVLVAAWALGRADGSVAEPPLPSAMVAPRPAKADLAEAVLDMVVARAEQAGLPQPVTLCEACVAANLGLPTSTIQKRCAKACGAR